MKTFQLLILIAVCCSCIDLKKPEQEDQIEALNLKITELAGLIVEFPSDSITEIISEILQIEEKIKKYSVNDTLTLENAMQIDEFKKVRIILEDSFDHNSTIVAELEKLKKSISNLQSDIQNSVGDRANYEVNIAFEEEKLNQLTLFIEDYDLKWRTCIETFYNLQPILKVFSEKLEHKNREQFLLKNSQ